MLKRKIKQLIMWIFVTVLLVPSTAFAANEDTELTLQYPLEEVYFTLYKVANYSEYGVFELVEPFGEYKEQIQNLKDIEKTPENFTAEDWGMLADTLHVYVVSKKILPTTRGITDKDGNLVFKGLEKGLYLVLGECAERDGKIYTPSSVLVTLPNLDEEGSWSNQVLMNYMGKVGIDPLYDSYKVTKIWDDDEYEKKRPSEIIVELYMKSSTEVYQTVKLSEENNWTFEWPDLPKGNQWTVVEKVVPEDYEVAYELDGNHFYIINTYKEEIPEKEPGDRAPETGQLWWPVSILTIAGLSLIIVGFMRRGREGR